LDFYIFEILTVRTLKRAKVRHHAKSRQNRSYCDRDTAIFPFFKMADVRHFGFSEKM